MRGKILGYNRVFGEINKRKSVGLSAHKTYGQKNKKVRFMKGWGCSEQKGVGFGLNSLGPGMRGPGCFKQNNQVNETRSHLAN